MTTQPTDAVAFAIAAPDGSITALGWMDIAKLEGFRKWVVLDDGYHYVYAIRARELDAQQGVGRKVPGPGDDWCTACGYAVPDLSQPPTQPGDAVEMTDHAKTLATFAANTTGITSDVQAALRAAIAAMPASGEGVAVVVEGHGPDGRALLWNDSLHDFLKNAQVGTRLVAARGEGNG